MLLSSTSIMQLAKGHMEYTQARHKVLAENVANADTPDYRARDLREWNENNFDRLLEAQLPVKRTAVGHIDPRGNVNQSFRDDEVRDPFEIVPSGNSVEIEEQVMEIASNRGAHNATVSIFQRQLSMYRMAIQAR